MKKRLTIVLIGTVCLATACAGPSGPRESLRPGQALGDEPISVVEFSQKDATIRYKAPHDGFGLAVAEEIASQLRKRGHDAEAVPADGTARRPVVVTGRIVRIDAGSRAERYWVGFGAGSAKFGVEGAVRRKGGDALGQFSDERWSGFGVFGGNSVSLVEKCLRSVGGDVAKMIDTGRYRTIEADD